MPKKRICFKRHYFFIVFFIFLLAGILYLKIPLWGGNSYTVATEKNLSEKRQIRGLFLYRETVVSLPETGTWCSGCVKGDSVAAGEPIGELKKLNDINTEPVEMIFSPTSGIYSDTFDGWEDLFQKGLPEGLNLSAVFKREQKTETVRINDFLQKGEPCFKVISVKGTVELLLDLGNLNWNRDTVTITLYGKNYQAEVEKKIMQEERTYILVSLPNESDFLQSRLIEPEIILGEKKGVIIQNSSIYSRFGKIGVYCNEKGKLQYREINVIAQNEDSSLVSGIKAGECLLFRGD